MRQTARCHTHCHLALGISSVAEGQSLPIIQCVLHRFRNVLALHARERSFDTTIRQPFGFHSYRLLVSLFFPRKIIHRLALLSLLIRSE